MYWGMVYAMKINTELLVNSTLSMKNPVMQDCLEANCVHKLTKRDRDLHILRKLADTELP